METNKDTAPKKYCCPFKGCDFSTNHQPSLSRHVNHAKKHKESSREQQMIEFMAKQFGEQIKNIIAPYAPKEEKPVFNEHAWNIEQCFRSKITENEWTTHDKSLKKVYVSRINYLHYASPIVTHKRVLFVKTNGEWTSFNAREIINKCMEQCVSIHMGHLLELPVKTSQQQDFRLQCLSGMVNIDLFNRGINFSDIDVETLKSEYDKVQ